MVLDGSTDIDPDGSMAAAIAGVIGNFEHNSSPPWSEEASWTGGMNWQGLMPSGYDQSNSGSYTIGAVTYQWSGSTTATSSSVGSPYASSGGDQSFDWSIHVVTNSHTTASGDNGAYSTAIDQGGSTDFSWHAWGSGGSISFAIDRTADYSNSNVLTLDAASGLDDNNTSSSHYHFSASGSVSSGVTNGTYSLDGFDKNHYSFHDGSLGGGAPSGDSAPSDPGFTLSYSKDRSYTVSQTGTAQSTTQSKTVSSGTDSYSLDESAGDSYGGGAKLGVKFDDDFNLTNSLGNSASGTADGLTLDTGGSDDYSLKTWEGSGDNSTDPNYGDGSGSGSGSGSGYASGSGSGSGYASGSGSGYASGASYGSGSGSGSEGYSGASAPSAMFSQAAAPQGGPAGQGGGGTAALDQRHAWHVGWDWATRGAPRVTYYSANSQWTQDLANSAAMQKIRADVAAQLAAGGAVVGQRVPFSYSLGGLSGLGTFTSDIAHMGGWAAGGFYRDPDYYSSYFNLAYLGSFSGYYQVMAIDPTKRLAAVNFLVTNTTSIESATRIPVIGYMPGSPIKSIISSKGWPNTKQVFTWSQIIPY